MTDNDQWTKKDYKEFCAKNGIRYALDSCANPISPTKRRLYDDHLYWTGTDKIGVHIERPTKTRYNNMKKKLLDLGCEAQQDADSEGNFFVAANKAKHVAVLIGANKNNISEKTREKMRERMRERWTSEVRCNNG